MAVVPANWTGAAGQLAAEAALPAGFQEQTVYGGLDLPTNVEFAPDGRVFVAEKAGVIKIFDDIADKTPTVFADLSTAVHNVLDRGLLGLALHPQFPAQPWVYVLYTYDAPPGATAPVYRDTCAAVGGGGAGRCVVTTRLSRLRAAGNVMTGAEQVLLHDWCQQYDSHSAGDLRFGADGALYLSHGDGASFSAVDYGQLGVPANPCGDPPGGTMVPPSAEGGALRSQDPRTPADPATLDGTILRLDPDTGAAAAGNPLINSSDANARRVVAHGLRNPYRFAIRPGTNELWIGDVGWRDWEEINRVPAPTTAVTNLGWPCLEGAGRQPGYDAANLTMCENLYAAGGYLGPLFAYAHSAKVVAGEACPAGGSSISGAAFYPAAGGEYPAAYRGAFFFADYTRDCIWAMRPTAPGGLPAPDNRVTFAAAASNPVDLAIGPGGDLYYVDGAGSVRRIRYFAGNQPPTAVLLASGTSGTAPLTVQFDAGASSDADPADAGLLRYEWDFTNDGTVDATTVRASHTYPSGGPYTVRLRVVDTLGAADTQTALIQSGNTPPAAVIDSPAATRGWRVGETVTFTGHGTDDQQGTLPAGGLHWRLVQQHCHTLDNCHAHTVQDWSGVASGAFVAPDHEYPSYLELVLTATDAGGLSQVSRVRLDPHTVDVTFASDPPGMQVAVGGTADTAPFTRTVIQGSANTVSAVTPQEIGGVPYAFAGWSAGGGQTHVYTAPAAAATVTASYVPQRVPRSRLALRYASTEETVAADYRAVNAFDGNPATMWHTRYTPTAVPMPHQIQLDLGARYAVTNLYYLPRQDHPNGRVARYEVYVSNDPTTWGGPVATGTFANAAAQQTVTFAAKTGRYVRLQTRSEVNGGPWSTVAELEVGVAPRLPQSALAVRSVSSEETVAADNRAVLAVDGDPATLWHTRYATDPAVPPHQLELDTGRVASVSCLFVLPRPGSPNGRIAEYDVRTSADGTTWAEGIAGTWSSADGEKSACFPARAARYVRLSALSEVGGRPWASAAEVSVAGN
ncbi:MAG TPA: discoidin domain-containing protein [Pilimelia sp.]|nr:discoidin domain-containing protein [Pilimelia sp.]